MMEQKNLGNLEMEQKKGVEGLLSKLMFISKIKINEKVNVSKLTLMENNWFNRIIRTIISTETRETTFKFLEAVIWPSLYIAETNIHAQNPSERQIGEIFLVNLEKSQIGISNLIETYNYDPMFTSRLETFLRILQTKISNLKN